MPKTRHEIAADVAHTFVPSKRQTSAAAASCFETLAVMIQARDLASMPDADFGDDILARMRDAANAVFDAQAAMHEVHAMLAPIRRDWGVPPGAYGPNESPKVFKPAGHLNAVA